MISHNHTPRFLGAAFLIVFVASILWYYLFFKSRYIPRLLSVWGLVTVCPIFIYGLLILYDRALETVIPMMIIGAPYILFETLIGPWLMIKGIRDIPLSK